MPRRITFDNVEGQEESYVFPNDAQDAEIQYVLYREQPHLFLKPDNTPRDEWMGKRYQLEKLDALAQVAEDMGRRRRKRDEELAGMSRQFGFGPSMLFDPIGGATRGLTYMAVPEAAKNLWLDMRNKFVSSAVGMVGGAALAPWTATGLIKDEEARRTTRNLVGAAGLVAAPPLAASMLYGAALEQTGLIEPGAGPEVLAEAIQAGATVQVGKEFRGFRADVPLPNVFSLSRWRRTIPEVAGGLGTTFGSMFLHTVGGALGIGPGLAMLSMFSMEYSDAYKTGIDAGMSKHQAAGWALPTAAGSAGLEYIGYSAVRRATSWLPKGRGSLLRKPVRNIMQSLAGFGSRHPGAIKNLKFLGKIMDHPFTTEIGTEVSQLVLQSRAMTGEYPTLDEIGATAFIAAGSVGPFTLSGSLYNKHYKTLTVDQQKAVMDQLVEKSGIKAKSVRADGITLEDGGELTPQEFFHRVFNDDGSMKKAEWAAVLDAGESGLTLETAIKRIKRKRRVITTRDLNLLHEALPFLKPSKRIGEAKGDSITELELMLQEENIEIAGFDSLGMTEEDAEDLRAKVQEAFQLSDEESFIAAGLYMQGFLNMAPGYGVSASEVYQTVIGAIKYDPNFVPPAKTREAAKDVRGYIHREWGGKFGYRWIIRGISNPDFGTAVHELAHFVSEGSRGELRRLIEDSAKAAGWAHGKIDNWTAVEKEKFARGFLAYIMRREAASPQWRSAYDLASHYLGQITNLTKRVMHRDTFNQTFPVSTSEMLGAVLEGPSLRWEGSWVDNAVSDVDQLMQKIKGSKTEVAVRGLRVFRNPAIEGQYIVRSAGGNTVTTTDEAGARALLEAELAKPRPDDGAMDENYAFDSDYEEDGKPKDFFRIYDETRQRETVEQWHNESEAMTQAMQEDPKAFEEWVKGIKKRVSAQISPSELLAIWKSTTDPRKLVEKILSGDFTPDDIAKWNLLAAEADHFMGSAVSNSGAILRATREIHAMREMVIGLAGMADQMTDAEKAEFMAEPSLESMMERYNRMPHGTKRERFGRFMTAFYYNNLLSNPGTAIVNLVGNHLWFGYLGLNRLHRAAWDKIIAQTTGNDRLVYASEGRDLLALIWRASFMKENPKLARDKDAIVQAKGAFWSAMRGEKTDFDTKWEVEAGVINWLIMQQELELKGRQLGGEALGKIAGKIGYGMSAPTLFLRATDIWYKTLAYDTEWKATTRWIRQMEEADRHEGIAEWIVTESKGPWVVGKVEEGIGPSSFRRHVQNYARTASDKKVLKNLDFDKLAFDKILQLRKTNPNLWEGFVDAAGQNRVARFQQHATFQDYAGPSLKAVLRFRNEHPIVMRGLMPFMLTPANLAKRGLEFIPGVGMAVARSRGAQANEIASKQMEGVMIGLTVFGMFAAGAITGPPPDDPAEREAWRRRGKRPWSIKIGPYWVEYRRIEPFGLPIGIIASVAQEIKDIAEYEADETKKGLLLEDKFFRIGGVATDYFVDSTFMSTFADALTAVGEAGRGGSGKPLKRVLAYPLAGVSIPYSSFWRSFGRGVEGTELGYVTIKENQSLMEVFGQSLPVGLPYALQEAGIIQPKYNTFGEPVKSYDGPLLFLREWLPFKFQEERTDEVEQEFMAVGSYPGMPYPRRVIAIRGGPKDGVRMSEEEYRDFIVSYGSRVKESLNEVVRRESYKQIEDKERRKYILWRAIGRAHEVESRKLRNVVRKRYLEEGPVRF